MSKEPKMKTCPYCGAEIEKKAKRCSFCGKKIKKPVFKRVWFWLLIIFILIIVAAAAGSGSGKNSKVQKVGKVGQTEASSASSSKSSDTSAPTEKGTEADAAVQEAKEDTSAEESEEDPAAATAESDTSGGSALKEVYHVGDILQDGDVRIVYAASGTYEGGEYSQPDEGYRIIFLKLSFENQSEDSDHSVSFYNFEGYADGYSVEMYYGGDEDLSATLSAGKKTVGYIYFTVPEDASEIEIEYESSFWTDEKIIFAYDGISDSGYEPEKDTSVSEDAHAVGETVELSDLRIKYLACEESESDNMFITPAEGFHFVKCTFEFENTGDSDAFISSYDFDAYADGISCSQSFFADDDLSATLSPGRKVKGSVTFEIPDSAVTAEVEYLDNIWTSKRIVFSVE